ncbi:MAG: long-chain fatty acid--CoA ligase [Candidatus Omnitrophica bacterium]|nr:long-chain fatty acid--CoA ligase [Candidatus Omnitrophota bacterium]
MKNLPEILSSGCDKHPHRTAIIFGQKKITYAETYKKASAVASALKSWEVKKGDRIALLLDNSPDFVFCYFGILMSGAIVVPINHMFKRDEVKYIVEDSESVCLLTSSAYSSMAMELNVIIDSLKFVALTNQNTQNARSLAVYLNGQNSITRDAVAEDPETENLAVFLYTSGTTGHPKGAMLTHANLLANAMSSSKTIRVNANDTFICFLPLFHSFAATVCMIMPLLNGAKTVIMKSPRPIKKLLRAIRKNKVTIFVGIPSLYQILTEVKLPKFMAGWLIRLLNPIRLAISGAAALPVEVFLKFEKKYRMPLLEGYGLTEASPVVSLNPLKGRRKPGSIGLAIPDVNVKITDDNGRTLEPEGIGELCVKGPNVMKGYFKKDEENKIVLRDGWLLTGDMAKIDKENYITIMGRKKDMVNVRGLNVYPREIEEVLYRHPLVREAAVIGIPDPRKGEVPKGYCVLKSTGSITEHEIIAYLKDHLALYKIPKRIEIRAQLPKNSSGKILKRILIEENLKNTQT